MSNLALFNKAIKAATKKFTEVEVSKFHRAVCIEALKRIVLRTPVDTGRARGNWQVQINAPASGIVDANKDAGSVIENGLAMLERIPPYSVVHITNNVEYIFYLEYIRPSKQHPEGMVEITITELQQWASKL